MGRWPNWHSLSRLQDTAGTQLFWIFQGSADADQAELADQAGDLRSALGHYKDALLYGDQGPWLAEVALIEWKLQDVGSALQYYRRNELYEIPLSQKIESQEGQLLSYCVSNQAQCQSDPKSFPWFGEPEFPQMMP